MSEALTPEPPAAPEPAPAPPRVRKVLAVWHAPILGMRRGHEEVIDLTEFVARAAVNGMLELLDPDTREKVDVPPPPPITRQGRGRRPRPRAR